MTRISLLKTRLKAASTLRGRLEIDPRRSGFSLIEMLVVVALIALISVFALPTVSSYFQISVSVASREIASVVKETYNSSVITGKIHRLVYDFKSQQYWVESGPPTLLLDTPESREKEERRRKAGLFKDEAPASPFQLEKSVTRKKMNLPRGVRFEDVSTQQSPEPLTEGTAYTHFFPHGFTEQTMIHLTDESKHRVTLVISALVGRTDLYERYVTAKEIFEK